ncbi:YtpR family tRNA-binding protein [Lactococcus petauri]|uniref:YtpR family tRNA-binding protein n=1 Tax=Lactococcus petauri TaxID=1940789 RepID=UPI0038523190
MIATYNKNVGDVLMLIVANNEGAEVTYERKADVARIFREDTGQTVGWNIFDIKKDWPDLAQGQNDLSEHQVTELNVKLKAAGFDEQLTYDGQPKFVVAEILTMEDHADSDHLHVCQVEVGLDAPVQIVCGAPNTVVGMKTVAALPGAMMPSGSLIWPGALRGVPSYGMLCSARELDLPNAPQVRGIIELNADLEAGSAFDATSMWQA